MTDQIFAHPLPEVQNLGDSARLKVTYLRVQIGDCSGPICDLRGRMAWALNELVVAGAAGVTPIRNPGPRWAAYCHKLKKLGIPIQSDREAHGQPFAGWHSVYRLSGPVRVLAVDSAA